MTLMPVTLSYKKLSEIPNICERSDLRQVVYGYSMEFRSSSLCLAKHQAATIAFDTFKATIITNTTSGHDWYHKHQFTVIAEKLDGTQAVAVSFWGPCSKGFQVIKKSKDMSWAEFCLRASAGATAPINEKKELHLYEISQGDGLILAEFGANFSYVMNNPQPKILPKGLVFSASEPDSRLFAVVCKNKYAVQSGGLAALVAASASGYLDRVCTLIINGVPGDKDNQAMKLAAQNGHKHVVEFFKTLSRLTPNFVEESDGW